MAGGRPSKDIEATHASGKSGKSQNWLVSESVSESLKVMWMIFFLQSIQVDFKWRS